MSLCTPCASRCKIHALSDSKEAAVGYDEIGLGIRDVTVATERAAERGIQTKGTSCSTRTARLRVSSPHPYPTRTRGVGAKHGNASAHRNNPRRPEPAHPRAMKIFNPVPGYVSPSEGVEGEFSFLPSLLPPFVSPPPRSLWLAVEGGEHAPSPPSFLHSVIHTDAVHAAHYTLDKVRAQSPLCGLGHVFPTDQRVLLSPLLRPFLRIPAVRALADRALASLGSSLVFVLAPVVRRAPTPPTLAALLYPYARAHAHATFRFPSSPRPQSMRYIHREYERKTTASSGGAEFQETGSEYGLRATCRGVYSLPSLSFFAVRSVLAASLCLVGVSSCSPSSQGASPPFVRMDDPSRPAVRGDAGGYSGLRMILRARSSMRLRGKSACVPHRVHILPSLPSHRLFPTVFRRPSPSVLFSLDFLPKIHILTSFPVPAPQRAILPSSKLYLRLIAHAEYDEDGMGRTRGVAVLFPYLIDVGRGIPRRLILIYLLRPRQLKRDEARRIPAKGPPDFIGIGWVDVGGTCAVLGRSSFFPRSFLVAFTLWSPAGGRARRRAPLATRSCAAASSMHEPPRTYFLAFFLYPYLWILLPSGWSSPSFVLVGTGHDGTICADTRPSSRFLAYFLFLFFGFRLSVPRTHPDLIIIYLLRPTIPTSRQHTLDEACTPAPPADMRKIPHEDRILSLGRDGWRGCGRYAHLSSVFLGSPYVGGERGLHVNARALPPHNHRAYCGPPFYKTSRLHTPASTKRARSRDAGWILLGWGGMWKVEDSDTRARFSCAEGSSMLRALLVLSYLLFVLFFVFGFRLRARDGWDGMATSCSDGEAPTLVLYTDSDTRGGFSCAEGSPAAVRALPRAS
ncbi:hypothetical protein C8R45DRAFT_1215956 [Mycena sanguinolenta]|nr:hypothetical protein C8R45DRAFT_1215956 [Mycena sanguinolenta]